MYWLFFVITIVLFNWKNILGLFIGLIMFIFDDDVNDEADTDDIED